MSKWEGRHVKNGVEFWRWPQCEQEATLEEVFPGMRNEHDRIQGFPITDHRPIFLTQLDRDLYEHTPDIGDVPLAAHEVWSTCPRYLDPSVIAKRARCTLREAIQLADALAILDADQKLSSEVCKWVFVRGIEATLHYLHRFLIGIAEAEHVTPESQDDEEPVVGFQDIRPLQELSVKELRRECKWREIPAPTRLRRWQLIALLDRADRSQVEPTDSEPETLAYAPMWEGEAQCDWIDSQPPWFQLLIMSIQKTETSEALSKISATVHEPTLHKKLSGDRASVFWAFYKNRRAWLARKFIIREKAAKMALRISEADAKAIPGIGIKLFQIQKGEIKGPKLNKREWDFVWAAWNERKAA
jgi:hypothetical protein